MNNIPPIKQILTGENAFYNHNSYLEDTNKEMLSEKPMENPSYIYNTESKIWRISRQIFSVIVFPVGVYNLIHTLGAKLTNPATTRHPYEALNKRYDLVKENFKLEDSWKFKRITVEVDGQKIDATIIGQANTLGNGRWVLRSGGNNELYESNLERNSFKNILANLEANAIVFNYPGVGASTGMPSRSAMTKAYHAMLNLLEDQEKGIGAKEIIGYGNSIGGGVQGDALVSHKLKEGIKYVFVKYQTFTDLADVASDLFKPLRILVKIFGWNFRSVESSKNLKASEIIVQTANVPNNYDVITDPNTVCGDGVIGKEASLAHKLMTDPGVEKGNKHFLGIREEHGVELQDPTGLTDKISKLLENLPEPVQM